MKTAKLCLLALALLFASPLLARRVPQSQSNAAQEPGQNVLPPHHATVPAETHIVHEVRHELLMLPRYTLFDWLAFRVDGNTVELLGDAITNGLKSDAVNAVKHVEGVEKVVDHINQLPLFPSDNRIRHAELRAISSRAGLSHYFWSAVPSIHIIVNAGHVRLEGIVDSQADKDAAFMRASGVPGVFQVINNLQVVKD